MDDSYLDAKQAAARLGISVATFYDWLGQSDHGMLEIRGQQLSIEYFQSGRQGQGKIQIPAAEIDRIRELMRVRPRRTVIRQAPIPAQSFPGITVRLGRPDQVR